jgi:hypothetical protein
VGRCRHVQVSKLFSINRVRPSGDGLPGCKDAYASVRRYMDMVAHVDSSDYICRRVDVKVRLSLEI